MKKKREEEKSKKKARGYSGCFKFCGCVLKSDVEEDSALTHVDELLDETLQSNKPRAIENENENESAPIQVEPLTTINDGSAKRLVSKRSNFGSHVLLADAESPRTRAVSTDSISSSKSLKAMQHPISKLNLFSKFPSSPRGRSDHKMFAFLRTFDSRDYEKIGFFDCLDELSEGDVVLFHTYKFASKLQRAFVNSGGFDHIGIVVICDECPDDSCCPPELKAARSAAGVQAWHTLEADSNGVSLYRFTPSCLGAYKGNVCIRHLHLDESKFPRNQFREKLHDFVKMINGRPYEKSMMQMIRAANIFGANEEEDLSSVFCSELVAAAYLTLGLIEPSNRPSNAYIPGDFASKNSKSKRAVRLVAGATLSVEKVIDCNNMRIGDPSNVPRVASGSSSQASSLDTLLPVDENHAIKSIPHSSSGSLQSADGHLSLLSKSKENRDSHRHPSAVSVPSPLASSIKPPPLSSIDSAETTARASSEVPASTSQHVQNEKNARRPKSLERPTPVSGPVRAPMRRSHSTVRDSFTKIMVKERLAQKRQRFSRQSSVSQNKDPLQLSDLRLNAGILANLGRSTKEESNNGDAASLSSATLSDSEDQDDIEEDESSDGSEPGLEQQERTQKLTKKEASAKSYSNVKSVGSQEERARMSKSHYSISSVDADGLFRSESSVGLEEDGAVNTVGTSVIQEDVTLQPFERHIEFLFVKSRALLNVNFEVTCPSETGSVSFALLGPLDSTLLSSLRGSKASKDAVFEQVLDQLHDQSDLVYEEPACSTTDEVFLNTVALKGPAWYELKWEYLVEEESRTSPPLRVSFLCHVDGAIQTPRAASPSSE